MNKPEEHICENSSCGKKFLRLRKTKMYCCRRCFKMAFYYRMKEKALREQKFPIYRCPKCHATIQLDFDPAKKFSPWATFQCPLCNTLMIRVIDEVCTKEAVIA
jgi:hypothetical protein